MDSQAQAQREYLKKYPLLLSPKVSSEAATRRSPPSNDRRPYYPHTPSRHRSRSPLCRRPRSWRSFSPISSRGPQSVLPRNLNTRLSGSTKSIHRNIKTRSRSRDGHGRTQHLAARSRSRSDGPTTTKNKHVRVSSMSREHTSHNSNKSLHLVSSSSLTDPSQLIAAFRSVSKSRGNSSRQHATPAEIPFSSLSEQTLSFNIDKKNYSLPSATLKGNREEVHLSSLGLAKEQRQSQSPSSRHDRYRGRHYSGDRRSISPPRSAGQLGERKYRDRHKSKGLGESLRAGLGSNGGESLNSVFGPQLAAVQQKKTNIGLEELDQGNNASQSDRHQALRPSGKVLGDVEWTQKFLSRPFSLGNTAAKRGAPQSDYYRLSDPRSHSLHGLFAPGDTPVSRGVKTSDRWRPRDVKDNDQKESLSFQPLSLANSVPTVPKLNMATRMSLNRDECALSSSDDFYGGTRTAAMDLNNPLQEQGILANKPFKRTSTQPQPEFRDHLPHSSRHLVARDLPFNQNNARRLFAKPIREILKPKNTTDSKSSRRGFVLRPSVMDAIFLRNSDISDISNSEEQPEQVSIHTTQNISNGRVANSTKLTSLVPLIPDAKSSPIRTIYSDRLTHDETNYYPQSSPAVKAKSKPDPLVKMEVEVVATTMSTEDTLSIQMSRQEYQEYTAFCEARKRGAL